MAPNRGTQKPNFVRDIGDNKSSIRDIWSILGGLLQNISSPIRFIPGGSIIIQDGGGTELMRFGYQDDGSVSVTLGSKNLSTSGAIGAGSLSANTIQTGGGSTLSMNVTSDIDGPILDITTY